MKIIANNIKCNPSYLLNLALSLKINKKSIKWILLDLWPLLYTNKRAEKNKPIPLKTSILNK